MNNFGIDFDILNRDIHVPVGQEKVTGNMVFGVNMDFTRKEQWVLY